MPDPIGHRFAGRQCRLHPAVAMPRLLAIILFCAGMFCLVQSHAQVPMTGAGKGAPGGGATGTAPTLDGTPDTAVAGTAASIITSGLNFAPAQAGDIVVICIGVETTGAAVPTVTTGSITGTGDFSGVTWSNLAGATALTKTVNPNGGASNPGLRVSCVWAFFSGALSGTNDIIIPFSGTVDGSALIVFAFHGCGNTSAPWDVNASLPTLTDSPGSSIPTDTGIATTALGTAVITFTMAANGSSGYTDQTAGSGWTLLGAGHQGTGTNFTGGAAQYKAFTTAQSGLSSPFTQSWLNWMTMSVALVGT